MLKYYTPAINVGERRGEGALINAIGDLLRLCSRIWVSLIATVMLFVEEAAQKGF